MANQSFLILIFLFISGMSPSQNGTFCQQQQQTAAQHHAGRCSVSGSSQQQAKTQQQFGLGEPQR